MAKFEEISVGCRLEYQGNIFKVHDIMHSADDLVGAEIELIHAADPSRVTFATDVEFGSSELTSFITFGDREWVYMTRVKCAGNNDVGVESIPAEVITLEDMNVVGQDWQDEYTTQSNENLVIEAYRLISKIQGAGGNATFNIQIGGKDITLGL